MNDGLKKYKVKERNGIKIGLIAVFIVALLAGGIYAFAATDVFSGFKGFISGKTVANSCTDTDGGNDANFKGIVTIIENRTSYNYTDYCTGTGNITEYYCEGNSFKSQESACSAGKKCINGACINFSTNAIINVSSSRNLSLPPTTATVWVSGTTATLSWSKVVGATSYIYKRYDGGVYCCQIIRNASLPTIVANTLPAGENYYYEVFAVNAAGTSIAKRTNNFTIISNTTKEDNEEDDNSNSNSNSNSQSDSSTTPSCSSKTCAADYSNQCSTSLSNGCGGTLNCENNCPADKTCVSGTCIIPLNDSCTDSDGQNTSVKGTVTEVLNSASSFYNDSCTNSSFVLEYYCNGTAKAFSDLLCPTNTTCSNGACTIQIASIPSTPDSCTDSDGQNTSVKGTVTEVLNGTSLSYDDSCTTNSSFVLEYYCNGTAKAFSDLLCPTNTTCAGGICA